MKYYIVMICQSYKHLKDPDGRIYSIPISNSETIRFACEGNYTTVPNERDENALVFDTYEEAKHCLETRCKGQPFDIVTEEYVEKILAKGNR